MQKPIISPEEIFQFLHDCNQERRREIKRADDIERISREYPEVNFN